MSSERVHAEKKTIFITLFNRKFVTRKNIRSEKVFFFAEGKCYKSSDERIRPYYKIQTSELRVSHFW